jgi:hypothetical protein
MYPFFLSARSSGVSKRRFLMNIFQATPIALDIKAVRTGLGWAQSWSPDGAVLCTLGNGYLQLTAVSEQRFVASWRIAAEGTPEGLVFFLFPSFVVETLAGRAAWALDDLKIVVYKNLVGVILREDTREYRLQWRWTAADFSAPRAFHRMNQLPDKMVKLPYVQVADVAHLAIAQLMRAIPIEMTEVDRNPAPTKDAILLDYTSALKDVEDANELKALQNQFYFQPRMLIRGLEIVRENEISMAISPVANGKQAILYLSCQRKEWTIHCALASVGTGVDSATGVTIRQTREPMLDGAWDLPKRK